MAIKNAENEKKKTCYRRHCSSKVLLLFYGTIAGCLVMNLFTISLVDAI